MKRDLQLLSVLLLGVATTVGCSMELGDGYYDQNVYPEGDMGEKYEEYGENDFLYASESPLSSFSVDADGASYANMRRFVLNEQPVPSASVRIEEYLNYFTFDYPEPKAGDLLSVSSEISVAPWNKEHFLLRLGIKAKSIEHAKLPPSNYVFLVDVSGSMASADKLDMLKDGLLMLSDNIRDDDRVTIVTYSGSVSMALEPTLGKDRQQIKSVIRELYASGSTNGGEAIKMAYEAAQEFYVEGGNNRVILATDGDFNVGVTSNEAMVELIENYLDSGTYLTVLGFGEGNLNDSMMEKVANSGNGNYEYIDCVAQMKKVFVEEITKLYCIAKDAKIQVDFDPEAVDQYRLIGYENRGMSNEDFDDERKDAGEIGVGQTITALYEIIPVDEASTQIDVVGAMALRYKDGSTGVSREINHSISSSMLSESSEDQNFAASLALYGMLLKESKYSGEGSAIMAAELAEGSCSFDPNGYRKEFVSLVKASEIYR